MMPRVEVSSSELDRSRAARRSWMSGRMNIGDAVMLPLDIDVDVSVQR